MAEEPRQRWEIADDLYIEFVDIAELREQDVNAQVMQPRQFTRLTENIRKRGMVESLPYCARPGDDGPTEIVSGHHRTRAARAAGLTRIPAIVDTRPMRRSELVAKQIAHNELHGSPDADILRELVKQVDNVDDLLTTGLPEDFLPTVGKDDTTLAVPHGEFDWRMVALVFLPHQLDTFEDTLKMIDKQTAFIGVADSAQFAAFSAAAYTFGRTRNIYNITTAITLLTEIARREIEAAAEDTTEA